MFAVRYLIDTLKSIPKWKRSMVPNLKVQHTTRELEEIANAILRPWMLQPLTRY